MKNISYVFKDKVIVKDFFIFVMCGDCIGFVGFNGIGKIILFKILFGDLILDSGSVK